ncbi:hypothetical protein K402DRAFT_110727 [Aulographum hederae CBS 113979]|uniref:FAD/NAD(P)-binding domain-containing protein n=1 Tax=Aulographum hederae CBS 113979 TaxID=1176131 RepID=A0A6G1GWK3_9PEZI|nr:hypothetical protein K402DRAFT_110727 [Aulographum hederae CBS 113979]
MLQQHYHIVILAATPGGIAAAIAAARRGRRVLILERSAFIGGLPANGLGATDIQTRGCAGGIFKEFVERIRCYYVGTYGEGSQQVVDCSNGFHFEPKAAETVFEDWLKKHCLVTVLRRRQFDAFPSDVSISDDSISSITVKNLETEICEVYRGDVFIDASYEGDLIAAAGVPFFVGREAATTYNEPSAGQVYKLWDGPECYGTTHGEDNAIQAYNYRLCLTKNPALRAPFLRPRKYDREEFVSLVRDIRTGDHTSAIDRLRCKQLEENWERSESNERPIPNVLTAFRRLVSPITLPNGKMDGNNQHLAYISTDLPEENWPYVTSSWAWRDAFAQRLRSYTEGLFYFAQNDEEVPQWYREELAPWGWANDEYTENDFFPRQMYVREGRRMKGKYIFTARDALPRPLYQADSSSSPLPNGQYGRPPVHKHSIAASHYALDSHGVRKREPDRVHLDGFLQYDTKPYTVPYGVMVPDSPIKNLLAPVPVSASHIGFSTLRMEPCWMAMGHAAGVAACLSLDNCGTAVESVDVSKLQEELLDDGAVIYYDPQLEHCASVEDWKNIQRCGLKRGK